MTLEIGDTEAEPAGRIFPQDPARPSLWSRISLRNVLFAGFLAIAVIPVGVLALWLERTAYQIELEEVSERHLLIARNLSHALERYSLDSEAVFRKSIGEMTAGKADENLSILLREMGFRHACILDGEGGLVSASLAAGVQPSEMSVPEFSVLKQHAADSPGRIAITGVLPNKSGEPSIYLVERMDNGSIAVAEMNTDYLVRLQRAIAFGKKGHSAIVDANGRVLAHPREEWRLEMKNISAVTPVKRMMAGETGVSTFYSPALNADMIAGFTTVPRTGWGVMVPQPLSELEEHAGRLQNLSFYVGGLGLLIAIALAWLLSRHLAAPIERMAAVAKAVRSGNEERRVGEVQTAPQEIDALARAFDEMLSELSRSSQELRVKAIESEAANRAKSRFLANMSHEFRTPLNAIIGYAEIMRDEVLGPLGANGEYHEQVTSIHSAGSHILQMVNEILLLTHAEVGQLEAHPGPIDIDCTFRFARKMMDHAVTEKNLELTCEVAPGITTVFADEGKLRQVLLNLLSNATKFTDPGGKIRLEASCVNDDLVEIRVTDNGIGIAPQDMEKVMKPFGQVQENYNRNHGGTGLGLPLTEELVKLMGGEFRLISASGEGTTAIVRLPLMAEAAGEAAA